MHTETRTNVAARIAGLTEPRGPVSPLHCVSDAGHYAALVASMETNGWVGAPVLVDGEQALTGSHRIAAARETWTDVPLVQVAGLCAEHGIDWAALVEDNNDSWYDAAIELPDLLPADVVAYLGIDLH